MPSVFTEAASKMRDFMPAAIEGQVADVVGLTIECDDFAAPVGAMVEIYCRHAGETVEAEVVGFRGDRSILMPYGEMRGFSRGDRVTLLHSKQTVPVGDALIGRVLNARGEAIDGKPAPFCPGRADIYASAPDAFSRPVIEEAITTGVKAIDGVFTCGQGQRMGIFAGSGVGKSTLLSMITRNTDADVVVLGLVGERGRELREFLDKDLGEEGLKRAVVVCETSDRPPLLRVKAAFTATAVAEYFRARGKKVMLLMDSLTRMAMAQREIGLSVGEPPTTKGYPPSVFNLMPRLLERSGAYGEGSITAFYTVLVEGDDTNEPIADTVRGILDGHIWLSRDLANKGHFPAIRVDDSISRLMPGITEKTHMQSSIRLRDLYMSYREAEDLINIGAYRQGSNPKIDEAIALHDGIVDFLKQDTHDVFTMEQSVEALADAVAGVPLTPQQKLAQQRQAQAQAQQHPGQRVGAPRNVGGVGSVGMQPGATPGAPNRAAGAAAAAANRTLGRTVEPNERVNAPASARMPAQLPPAPGQNPVQPPTPRR